MKKNNHPKVCIVIPAYNEGSVLGDVLQNLKKKLKNTAYDTTIVVINDGSTDNTSVVAKANGVVVIDHILNSGAGDATATGIEFARRGDFDITATMDADGQHAPNDVLKGIEIIKQSHDIGMLIGSRLIDTTGMSKRKILGNKGLSKITHMLFGINVTDSQSGLRIFSRDALEKIYWKSRGYEFCSEMLWRAKQNNIIVDEYPITAIYTDYSRSKGQNNWNAINIIKSLLRSRFVEIFE